MQLNGMGPHSQVPLLWYTFAARIAERRTVPRPPRPSCKVRETANSDSLSESQTHLSQELFIIVHGIERGRESGQPFELGRDLLGDDHCEG